MQGLGEGKHPKWLSYLSASVASDLIHILEAGKGSPPKLQTDRMHGANLKVLAPAHAH